MVRSGRSSRRSAVDRGLDRLDSFLERTHLFEDTRRLLLAVSGGPDSTALALLFRDWYQARAGTDPATGSDLPEVYLGHVHHGLRGAQADGDESFVRALAAELGFPLCVEKVAVSEVAQGEKLSLESAARKVRYEAFRRWAQELDLDAIALAHHREDQQETVLLRVLRGAGISGLRGIPVARPLDGCGRPVRIIRPLLGWTRAEILEFLEAEGKGFRTDQSNAEWICPRNVVRNAVLPLLESRVHPGTRKALERLAHLAEALSRDLDVLAERASTEASLRQDAACVVFDLRSLGSWPPVVVREVLVKAVSRVAPGRPPFSSKAWKRVEGLLRRPNRVGRVDLDGTVAAESRYGQLSVFCRGCESRDREAEAPVQVLETDAAPVRWGSWLLGADRRTWDGPTADRFEEWVDAERLESSLRVRSRLPGDRFHPLGAPGTVKLKEFLRARRIYPRERDSVPLVVSGRQIVWVVGERLDHRYRVRADTVKTLRLYAEPVSDHPARGRRQVVS